MSELPKVHEPYVDPKQQHEADLLGIHIFLCSEIMLFGGLFMAIAVARYQHPEEIVKHSKELHYYIGAINTAILLTSSFLVAVAVQAARAARQRTVWATLAVSAGLGLLFLAMKGFEYYTEYGDGKLPVPGGMDNITTPTGKLFLDLYLVSTALHAVHVTVGIVILTVVAFNVFTRRSPLPQRSVVVETSAAYWHLVDVIWIFLYPVLYLAR